MANSTGQIFLGELVLPLPPAIAALGPGSASATTVQDDPRQQTIPASIGDDEQNNEVIDYNGPLETDPELIAHIADEAYASLIPEEQIYARRILLRMVRPGDGSEVTNTRIRRSELYREYDDRIRIDRVLEKLVAARLLIFTAGDTPDDVQIEVAHEAMVSEWPTLVSWIEEERIALATRQRLEAQAEEWERLGRGNGGLLDHVDLREAERWLSSFEAFELGFSLLLQDFVAASREAIKEEDIKHAQLEQQRADIQRRLQQLEQRSHRTPEPTPQSETEAAELRHQLDEIERQIAALPAEAGAQQTAPDIEVSPDEAPLTNISLHIARQGSGYSISLVSGTSIMQATLAPSEAQLEELAGLARRRLDEVVKTQVDGQLVYQSPQATIAPEVHAQSLRALAEAGSFMHQQLFFRPDSGRDSHVLGNRLRELSQRARLRITIISERLFLPWALLYDREIIEPGNIDAEGFWGFKHVIECQLPSTAPQQSAVLSFEDVVGEASPIIVPGGQLELGFVGDNAVDAQFSQPIVVQQRASMSSLPRVHVQDYSSASDFYRLLSDGSMVADVIYIYAHLPGNSDAGVGDVRIRLGDQDISLRELRARLPVTPLPGRPFVFMNAERVLNADLTQTDSFVPYFLQRGARAVLGGEASLPAFFAAQFGVEFVSRFVAGEQSAGNLLLALRRAYLTQRNNLLGLIYTLYGHADTQVEWDESEAEEEIPRPARKGERPATKRAPGSAAALPASILEQLREQLNDLLTELEASNDLPLRDAENLHAHLELAIQAAEQDVPNRQQILDKLSAMGKITRSLRSRYDSARILDQQISSAQRSAKDLTSTPPTSFA